MIRVDLGLMARMFLSDLLNASTLVPQGWLMKLRWRKAPPSDVWTLLPAISWVSLGVSWVSKRIAYELSLTRYVYLVRY